MSEFQTLPCPFVNLHTHTHTQHTHVLQEKFAERYVNDNPGQFVSADGAYMLAFAIIMLNTDCHNPLAERRLQVRKAEGGVDVGVGVYQYPTAATRWLSGGCR